MQVTLLAGGVEHVVAVPNPVITRATAKPRALCSGVSTRDFGALRRPGGGPGIMYPLVTARLDESSPRGSVVIHPTWAELQPNPGALSAVAVAALRENLDYCQSLGLLVRLRVQIGVGAPAWVRAEVGFAPQWGTSHAVQPGWLPAPGDSTGTVFLIPGGMVRSWNPLYWDLHRDLQVRLAAAIGGHPALAEVVVGMSATQFQEPCILQFGHQPNCDAAVSSGFTDDVWETMFTRSFEIHRDVWVPHGVAAFTAWNPMGDLVAASTASGFKYRGPVSPASVGIARTVRMMREAVRVLGPFAVIGNCSLTDPEPSGLYNAMYAEHERLRAAGQPIAFQSETLVKIGQKGLTGVLGVLAKARAMGASNLELPVGCQIESAGPSFYVSPADAAQYNAWLFENTRGLVAA